MSSAKLLHSFADQNPDLQKQMGCISGIFQMFDREITHKRVPSSCLGALQLDNDPGRDSSRKQTDNEKQRGVSTESTSRASFSSSCSSSSASSQDRNDQLNISNVDNKLRNAGKSKIRPPGVVAKLMGLEPLPDSASQKEISFTKKPSRTMEAKQIPDAIQSNWLSENKVSNFVSPKNAECRNRYGSLPIVILKPATIVERHVLLCSSSVIAVGPFLNPQKFKENDSNGGSNSRKAKNQSPPRKSINNDRKSTRSIVQQLSKRQSRSSNSVQISGCLSSKLKQKKLELPLTSSKSKMSAFKHGVSYLKMEGEFTSSVQPCKELLQLRDDKPRLEHATRAAEHPSPVSVLDLSEYTDDESPPVKQEPHSIKGGTDNWVDRSSNSYNVKVGEKGGEPPLMNDQKLLYINHLVQNLINLNPGHDEQQTDYIASLCENCMNPDHKYIAEIFVISGLLLTDLSSDSLPFKLHPSGCPINPELFYVLEKTNTCLKPKKKKIHRRLIFDAVNEILLKKLTFAVDNMSRVRPKRVAWTARKLLKEVCFEIDLLGAKQKPIDDIVSWKLDDCHSEVSGMVLGIERLIFKQLVCEVLIGASDGAEARPNMRRRLFLE